VLFIFFLKSKKHTLTNKIGVSKRLHPLSQNSEEVATFNKMN